MVNSHNVKLRKELKSSKYKRNLTKDEEDGLRWLVKKTSAGDISVFKADKGGAILIIYPSLLQQKFWISLKMKICMIDLTRILLINFTPNSLIYGLMVS